MQNLSLLGSLANFEQTRSAARPDNAFGHVTHDRFKASLGTNPVEHLQCPASADFELIALARRAIAEIFKVRYLGVQSPAHFRSTDLASLAPHMQEAESKLARETECRDRIRVALHMSLTSASVALEVADALLVGPAQLALAEREAAMIKLGEDAMGASDAAKHAALVLSGEERPENDMFFAETNF